MSEHDHRPRLEDLLLTRREMLGRCGMGFGALGLSTLLSPPVLAATGAGGSRPGGYSSPLAPQAPPLPAKAKHVIHLFMNGGPSHVDTFDPKPELTRYNGKPLPRPNLPTERKTGAALGSPFKFSKYGQSGIEVSELYPNVGACIDDIA